MMLAYGHILSHGHQGFRPFSNDHREAAGPVGPAVARIKVYCKLQTVTSCALATASMAVMEVMNYVTCYYSGAWRWVKPLIWAEGPPIGLYLTAEVRGVRSLHVGNQVVVHFSRKRTLYASLPFLYMRVCVRELRPPEPGVRRGQATVTSLLQTPSPTAYSPTTRLRNKRGPIENPHRERPQGGYSLYPVCLPIRFRFSAAIRLL